METAYLDIFWWQYGCLEHANQINAHWRSTLFCRSGLRRFYECFCESKLTSAAVIHEGTSYKLFWATFKADSICYPNDKLSVVYFFKVFTGHPAVLGISLVRIACPLPLSHHPLFLSTSTSLFFLCPSLSLVRPAALVLRSSNPLCLYPPVQNFCPCLCA